MTDKERYKIECYRDKGRSYAEIAKNLDLSINTVKTYCKRHNLGGVRGGRHVKVGEPCACANCGSPVYQIKGRRRKRFCSDKCRNLWWNSHMDLVNRKAYYECDCKNCGKHFTAYGDNDRKYCSRECYLEARWGGKREHA